MPVNVNVLKKLIQELIVSDLQEIKSEIKLLHAENKRIDEKVESVKEGVRNLREEFKLAIDIHERLATLEAKIGH